MWRAGIENSKAGVRVRPVLQERCFIAASKDFGRSLFTVPSGGSTHLPGRLDTNQIAYGIAQRCRKRVLGAQSAAEPSSGCAIARGGEEVRPALVS